MDNEIVTPDTQANILSSRDIAALEQQDTKTLARWWGQLNRYEWPEDLPSPEPSQYVPSGRRSNIMTWIATRITIKECLREWNKDDLPGVAFDDWYDKTSSNKAVF